jgi:hypothetical protein
MAARLVVLELVMAPLHVMAAIWSVFIAVCFVLLLPVATLNPDRADRAIERLRRAYLARAQSFQDWLAEMLGLEEDENGAA